MNEIDDIGQEIAETGRRMRIVRQMPAAATPEQAMDALVYGIDPDDTDDASESPREFWQPADADALDRLVAAQVMRIRHWRAIEQRASLARRAAESRITKLVNAYQDLLTAALPAPGKTRGQWEGPHSGGKYIGTERLPELRITEENAANAAGLLTHKAVRVINTLACREAMDSGYNLAGYGIEVIPQPIVQFKVPSND